VARRPHNSNRSASARDAAWLDVPAQPKLQKPGKRRVRFFSRQENAPLRRLATSKASAAALRIERTRRNFNRGSPSSHQMPARVRLASSRPSTLPPQGGRTRLFCQQPRRFGIVSRGHGAPRNKVRFFFTGDAGGPAVRRRDYSNQSSGPEPVARRKNRRPEFPFCLVFGRRR